MLFGEASWWKCVNGLMVAAGKGVIHLLRGAAVPWWMYWGLRFWLLIPDRTPDWHIARTDQIMFFGFCVCFLLYPRIWLAILDWRACSLCPLHSSDISAGINFVVKDTAVVGNILNV